MNPSHGDQRLDLAAKRWGWHPMHWPVPARSQPKIWQFSAVRYDRELREVFGAFNRDEFWRECRSGQSVYEDAGGYMLRCYKAMIGLPVEEPYTYAQAIRALTEER